MRTNEHFVEYVEPADVDAYEDLRNATPEELLEAAEWFLRQGVDLSFAKTIEDVSKFCVLVSNWPVPAAGSASRRIG